MKFDIFIRSLIENNGNEENNVRYQKKLNRKIICIVKMGLTLKKDVPIIHSLYGCHAAYINKEW